MFYVSPIYYFSDHEVVNISKDKRFVQYQVCTMIAKVKAMFFSFHARSAPVLAATTHPQNDSKYIYLVKSIFTHLLPPGYCEY